jgi:restriction system protein
MNHFTFLESALQVLIQSGKAMHYNEITNEAITQKLIYTRGKTPQFSMDSRITTDIKNKGNESEFINLGNGWFDLRNRIKNNNIDRSIIKYKDIKPEEDKDKDNNLSSNLLTKIKELSPSSFQNFVINKLLPNLGLTEVISRQFVKDGGIDGEGILEISGSTIIAGITKDASKFTKCGIQVKRWDATITRPDIQTFRGAMTVEFEYGLYITTSNFSKDALEEANIQKTGVIPIMTINGNTLVELMLKKSLGTKEVLTKVIDEEFFDSFI